MSYLYGDSSTSPLQSNFIELLGHALDFSVQLHLANERMERGTERIVELQRACASEVLRLEAIEATVVAAVGAAPQGSPESSAAMCATTVLQGVSEVVRTHVTGARDALAAEIAKIEAVDLQERDGCVRALEALLLRHDTPDTSTSLSLVQRGGTHYAAHLTGKTPYGLEWLVEVAIPATHPFAHVTRVDRLIPHLEVHAPESSGWLRKEIKNRPQKLERYYITELTIEPSQTTIALRANADGSGGGFDAEIGGEPEQVRLVRIDEQGARLAPEFEISEADADKLRALHEKLRASEGELGRERLIEAKLDGDLFRDHEEPTALVERLVAVLVPITRDIARHSLASTELVLKRLVGDNRREEIFVSKATLAAKLDRLPESLRARFRDLELCETVAPSRVEPFAARSEPVAKAAVA